MYDRPRLCCMGFRCPDLARRTLCYENIPRYAKIPKGACRESMKYAITHRLGLIKGRGITMPQLRLKRNPDVEAAVVEEIDAEYSPSGSIICYRVVFRAIRQDTQEVIESTLSPYGGVP